MWGRGPRAVVVVVLLASALVVAGVAVWWPPDERAGAAPGSVATPLWSPRRLPGPIVDPLTVARERVAAAGLQQALDAEAARYGAACFVVRRGATVLAARNPDLPLIPASTQKLVSAAAALTALGPDFRFETRAVASGGGASVERLWVVGAGDPVMRHAEYADVGVSTIVETLADAIVARGVRRVGTVVADDHRYDQERFVPTWKPSYRIDLDVGPLGALVVDQGVTLATGRPSLVDDPGVHFAAVLTELLQARGVTVGEPTRGRAPADAPLVASVTSQPLRSIVGWMLASSDNVTAELLTKEIGVRKRGAGTTAAGVAATRDVLASLGVPIEVPAVDGSGLDRGNRLTCDDLAAVAALGDRPELRVLRDTLPGDPRPGGDGRIRSKSGYLDDVTGFAGVVGAEQPLAFGVLVNGGVPSPSRNAVAEMRKVAAILADYRRPDPVPDALVPEPAR